MEWYRAELPLSHPGDTASADTDLEVFPMSQRADDEMIKTCAQISLQHLRVGPDLRLFFQLREPVRHQLIVLNNQ